MPIILAALLIYSCITHASILEEIEPDWSVYSPTEMKEEWNENKWDNQRADLQNLEKAKLAIISGEIKRALFYLKKIDENIPVLGAIKLRYQALADFLREEYDQSLEAIEKLERNHLRSDSVTNFIKMLGLITKGPSAKLRDAIRIFQAQSRNYSKNDQLWLHNFERLLYNKEKLFSSEVVGDINYLSSSIDMTRIWLKTGILLGMEKSTEAKFGAIPFRYFRSKRIREIIGFTYYRLGNYAKAMSYVENLHSSNSENIKGNLMLLEGKHEIAFGHFNLAIKSKFNSLTALERAIPLAWDLGKWEEGRELLKRMINKKIDARKKLTLDTAFRLRKGEISKAFSQLEVLNAKFDDKPPREVGQMLAYASLLQDDGEIFIHSSDEACRQYDGTSCWLLMQSTIWQNLSKTLQRDDKIIENIDEALDALIFEGNTKIEEKSIVNQVEIDELDAYEMKF